VEVEHVETALQLVAQGLGATAVARAVLNGSTTADTLSAVGFVDPVYDFFALVTRRGVRLSSGMNEMVELIDEWGGAVAMALQRGAVAARPATEP
jgi:DNA-binding transcriptional LysR family regulator